MALGYLLGKGSSKPLKVNLNVSLVFVLAIIPDIDILFEPLITHRGPTHSFITALIVFIPIFIIYRKRAAPYFLSLASHGLIGDFFAGGKVQLLWPFSREGFGFNISITSPLNVAVEVVLFLAATYILYRSRDYRQFLQPSKTNFILAIPIFTVLLPSVAGFPIAVPLALVVPHLFYLVLFSLAVLIVLKSLFTKSAGSEKKEEKAEKPAG